jgi:hypothetical protein
MSEPESSGKCVEGKLGDILLLRTSRGYCAGMVVRITAEILFVKLYRVVPRDTENVRKFVVMMRKPWFSGNRTRTDYGGGVVNLRTGAATIAAERRAIMNLPAQGAPGSRSSGSICVDSCIPGPIVYGMALKTVRIHNVDATPDTMETQD